MVLTQEAVYPVTLIFHSQFYNLVTGDHNWFINTPEERDFVLQFFPQFAALGNHFKTTGFALRSLDLDQVEYGLLSIIAVVTPSGRGQHWLVLLSGQDRFITRGHT